MDREYLLTYLNKEKEQYDFEWLETEQELLDRIEELGDTIIIQEAIRVVVVEHFE